jgi:hypothetical protein
LFVQSAFERVFLSKATATYRRRSYIFFKFVSQTKWDKKIGPEKIEEKERKTERERERDRKREREIERREEKVVKRDK